VFQLSTLSSSTVLFWRFALPPLSPREHSKFGPNNCITNIFLHGEFQIYILSRLKVCFGGLPLDDPKFGQNNCLICNPLHCEFQFSMLSNLKVLFWGILPPKDPQMHPQFFGAAISAPPLLLPPVS